MPESTGSLPFCSRAQSDDSFALRNLQLETSDQSSEPMIGLQGWPVDDSLGRSVSTFFVAAKGRASGGGDWSVRAAPGPHCKSLNQREQLKHIQRPQLSRTLDLFGSVLRFL